MHFLGRNYVSSKVWHLVLDSNRVMIDSQSRRLELVDDLLLLVPCRNIFDRYDARS